jgi:hypothetical protein
MKPYSLLPVYASQLEIDGAVGDLLKAVTENWLLVAPKANPAMLEMFADRDTPPYRALLPWSGEFAGKYLTSAVQVYRLTRDARLKDWLAEFVGRLVSLQASDGYLGPWPADTRLANFSPHHGSEKANGDPSHPPNIGMRNWDTWSHYHILTGLILWHEETANRQALDCACRIGDLICEKYLGTRKVRLVDTGYSEMNLAPAHALAHLYRLTGTDRYLQMAEQIVEEFAARDENGPLAGDYINGPLAGKAFHELPRPRWESLHPIMTLAELYWITGEERFRTAFEQIWWSIVEGDRHNNGGFSSGEQATGNPYDPAPIETCCTIAWIALSVEMLKLTGESIVADEIELSTLNSVLGMHSASGRWATYNTPSDGARFASAHHIVFQCRSGSSELNCCSVNSPRGLGMMSEWASMSDEDGLFLNYYGPSRFSLIVREGLSVDLRQETNYPISGGIKITVTPSQPAEFSLSLRIPYWSRNTRLSLNGQTLEEAQPGSYYPLRRTWKAEDNLELELDMGLHYWHGEKQCQGLVSIYRGPILLAYDQRYNPSSAVHQKVHAVPDDLREVTQDWVRENLPVPALNARDLRMESVAWDGWHPPQILLEGQTAQGRPVRLCDFASAGATGTLYRTWLPVSPTLPSQAFTRRNPLRSSP